MVWFIEACSLAIQILKIRNGTATTIRKVLVPILSPICRMLCDRSRFIRADEYHESSINAGKSIRSCIILSAEPSVLCPKRAKTANKVQLSGILNGVFKTFFS